MIFNRRQFVGSGLSAAAGVMLPRVAVAQEIVTLTTKPSTAPLLGKDKAATAIWAFNGVTPGPVIRAKQGERVRVRIQNELPQPTSVHWHGIRIANAMDGVTGLTQAAIPVGGQFEYDFVVPDAGTYWYHSHHRSWEQIARGLYGPLIVEEATPPAFDDEQLFLVDDWRLGNDGVIDELGFSHMHDRAHGGRLGNWLTINGTSRPTASVRSGDYIRLRCINAANARIMAFDFNKLNPVLLTLDGQPLAVPTPLTSPLELAPAQRADLVLRPKGEVGQHLDVSEVSTREPVLAARYMISDAGRLRNDAIAALPSNPFPTQLDMASAAKTDLLMEGGAMGQLRQAKYKGQMFEIRELARQGFVWSFNGAVGRQDEPLLRLARGQTAVVNMINDTRWPHGMHLHGHHFKVIERGDKSVANAPWRDTELVQPGERVRIAFVADNPGKWLFHCHMLEHTAAGMATWVEVA